MMVHLEQCVDWEPVLRACDIATLLKLSRSGQGLEDLLETPFMPLCSIMKEMQNRNEINYV